MWFAGGDGQQTVMDVYTKTAGLRRVVRHPCVCVNMAGRLLICLALCSSVVLSSSDYVLEHFSDITNNGDFNHLVVDSRTSKVYVGAVNRLYQLSETLGLQKSLTTGPKNDSPNCPPSIDCDYEKISTNSVNKALLIDYKNSRLIACFNLYQGHCEKLMLNDLNVKDPPVWMSIVPSDEQSSVTMFIAPGYPNPASTEALYVGATRSTKGETGFKDLLPAVCSRNLHDFELVYDNKIVASKMEIEVQHRETFRVDYVFGFGSGQFSYFLTVQKESVEIGSDNDFATRIVRVCQGDGKFFSYTELPLQCMHNGTNFNILRSATVAHPGAELARSLLLSDQPPHTDMEHVLFATFSRSEPSSSEPLADSVMCVYSLRDIRRKFTETISGCFKGVGNIGPAHFVLPSSCSQTVSQAMHAP